MKTYSTGAEKSPYDIRTFTYAPTKASVKAGIRWEEKDIEDQKRVGICTAISTVMRAQKHFNKKFSPEFQYLCQKKFYDNNWNEGSSIFHALKVGKDIGFLPLEEFPTVDRNLPYHEYIEKLKSIPDSEIERMKKIASQYKLKAYASVPVTRETMANAIEEQGALLQRFSLGNEWWTSPIEPLRSPKTVISGHAVNSTNTNGDSFRIANSWGVKWADKGTAYHLLNEYAPTEAWAVWFDEVPKEIKKQEDSRATTIGKIMDLLQQVIVLLAKLK